MTSLVELLDACGDGDMLRLGADYRRVVRGLIETLAAVEAENAKLRATMRAVNDNALAWHAGEDGKARSLNVIAVWTSEALAGRLHPATAQEAGENASLAAGAEAVSGSESGAGGGAP